jgi:hypothetical protein
VRLPLEIRVLELVVRDLFIRAENQGTHTMDKFFKQTLLGNVLQFLVFFIHYNMHQIHHFAITPHHPGSRKLVLQRRIDETGAYLRT